MARSIHDEELLHDHDEEAEEAAAAHGSGLLGAFSRKTMVILIGVIVVIGAIGVTLVVYTVDEGSVLSVELTGPSRSEDLLTFAYTIHTDRAAATGETTLTVTGGGGVYTRTFNAGGGGGRIDVRFADFVTGNGDYVFKVAYKGKSAQATYTVGVPDQTSFIVTAIGAPTFPAGGEPVRTVYIGDGHIGALNYTLYFFSDIATGIQARAPPGSFLAMQVTRGGLPVGQVLNVSVEGKTFYTTNFEVQAGPGNYSVDATFTNQWVRPDAAIKSITLSNKTFVQNRPYACVGGPYHGNNANGYTITADASCSHDDLTIVQYTWTFGDNTSPVTNGAIPTEGHTYPSSVITQTYHGTVCVEDGMSPFDPTLMCVEFIVTTSQN